MALSGQDILNTPDRPIHRESVPEWGGDVCLRPMGGNDRDDMGIRSAQSQEHPETLKGFRAFVLSRVLCDEEGALLFTKPDDVFALGEKNGAVLERLFEIALDMNGMGEMAVEEASGNSDGALSADSGSNSHLHWE